MAEYREYRVTMRFEFPAWDETDGIPYDVTATSKTHAIKIARSRAEHDGHAIGGSGRYWFKAEELDDGAA